MILFDTKDYFKTRSILSKQKSPINPYYTKPFVIITDKSVQELITKKFNEFNDKYFNVIHHRDLYQTCLVNLQTEISNFKSSRRCLERQSNFNLFYNVTIQYFFYKRNRLNYEICEEIEFKSYLTSVAQNGTVKNKSVVMIFAKLNNLEIFKKPKVISSFSSVVLLGVASVVSQFKSQIHELNSDVTFGFLGSEDSILTNKSSEFIMNEIKQNQLNRSGTLTNV